MDFFNIVIQTLDSTIRLSVPLLLACLAGLYSERSGIFDIGLEGKMLAAAFAGAAAASVFHSAWIGLGIAILISVSLALVHGFASITHRGNQIVSGLAINFVAAGSTIILGQAWFQQGGRHALSTYRFFPGRPLRFSKALRAQVNWAFDVRRNPVFRAGSPVWRACPAGNARALSRTRGAPWTAATAKPNCFQCCEINNKCNLYFTIV